MGWAIKLLCGFTMSFVYITVAWNASAVGSPLSQAVASPGVYLVSALVPCVYPIYSWTHAWFWLWFVVELVEHFPVVYGLIVSLHVATFQT